MKVPAVTIDVTDDGTAYTVTALPWPTIESSPHPFIARLVHTQERKWVLPDGSVDVTRYPMKWTADKLAAFIKKLMASYPKVSV